MNATIPTEHQEQVDFFRWCELRSVQIPGLKMVHATPNAGKRSWATGKAMKEEGLRAGFPDISIHAPANGFHGLHIELKRDRRSKSKVTASQLWWLASLQDMGYACALCYGAEEAKAKALAYFNGPKWEKTDFWAMWEAESVKQAKRRGGSSSISHRIGPRIGGRRAW